MRSVLRGLSGVAVLLVVWEAFGRSGLFPDGYLPPPSVVFPQLLTMLASREYLLGIVATALSWAIALGIATVIAVPAGLLLASVPMVRTASRAVVEFLRPIPSVALVPLAIVAVGGGPATKIGLAAFASLWPILFNTIYAFGEVEPLYVETARAFGTGRATVLGRVVLPTVAPFVLTGVRLSSAIGLAVVISAEILTGASGGIGSFILAAASGATRMDRVLAGVVVAGVLGYLINAGLEWLQRRLFGWHAASGKPAS
ncbi:ABC transporter permease subunit [Solihabitans fulvus]|uniref:ABC transporter permease subunit n=1 Tax=Solihabitans fulvus TaxID=1892852 RepID=A0A5B2X0K8_9PSEU|nr:ABC transporter permease subunit [Solihabitans fulvus]KAA2255927.1 ABC transporter permease subunit [Solihabitans fulvus]